MKIDSKLVKKLREFSGAGMLDVKKALIAAEGQFEKAIQYLKEKGLSNANKKLDRIASDGLVGTSSSVNKAIIMELNCETDFVALTNDFKDLFKLIINIIIDENIATLDKVNDFIIDDKKIEIIIKEVSAKLGEKIHLRRFKIITKNDNESFGLYTHSNGKIASIVVINKGNEKVARNVSMHLSAMNPRYMTSNDISPKEIETYKNDILKEISNINKPDNIKEIIALGKMKKILSEMVLVDQEFVMENKKSISEYLKENNAHFINAIRYEVGEGIEKKESNFSDEVKSQMK